MILRGFHYKLGAGYLGRSGFVLGRSNARKFKWPHNAVNVAAGLNAKAAGTGIWYEYTGGWKMTDEQLQERQTKTETRVAKSAERIRTLRLQGLRRALGLALTDARAIAYGRDDARYKMMVDAIKMTLSTANEL